MGEVVYPKRSVTIEGQAARILAVALNPPKPNEIKVIKDAVALDELRGEEGDEFHCPLCNEFFAFETLVAHAPQCIAIRAPRHRIWSPPGFSSNVVQVYSDERPARPGSGRFDNY